MNKLTKLIVAIPNCYSVLLVLLIGDGEKTVERCTRGYDA